MIVLTGLTQPCLQKRKEFALRGPSLLQKLSVQSCRLRGRLSADPCYWKGIAKGGEPKDSLAYVLGIEQQVCIPRPSNW